MGLRELAIKHHTDKAFFYASFYEELLKGLEVRKMIEIGIGSQEVMKDSISRAEWGDYAPGASLRMWAEYYPDAYICALDNNPNIFINEGRIRSFYLEQSDPYSYPVSELGLGLLGFNFDLIIDDGSHKREDQLLARKLLFPLLRTGGYYITEDITDPDSWPDACARFENEYGKAALSWICR